MCNGSGPELPADVSIEPTGEAVAAVLGVIVSDEVAVGEISGVDSVAGINGLVGLG